MRAAMMQKLRIIGFVPYPGGISWGFTFCCPFPQATTLARLWAVYR